MVAAVADHGYEAVTVEELVALAGISKRDFYESFASKEACFLATFEEIVGRAAATISAAYRTGSGYRGKLLAALRAYAQLVADEPAAASLAIIDSLGLGTTAVALHEAAEEGFVAILRQSFAQTPERGEIGEVAVRGIIGGGRQVVYACLREGRPERFLQYADLLLDWTLGYRRVEGRHLLSEESFAAWELRRAEREAEREGEEEEPDWSEPAASERSRATLAPRERIVRAVAQLAAADGYASLSMPAIAATAAVSNRTFYREFADKQEAFLAAFDGLAERVLRRAVPAFEEQPTWPEAIGAELTTTLSLIAANPLFARLVFIESTAAGPPGRDRAQAATRRILAPLAVGAPQQGIEPLPEIILEAIGGGIWTVLQQEVAHGRGESLPALAPELADFVLVPFGVEGDGG